MYGGHDILYVTQMTPSTAMKVTTVRFSRDLWDTVAEEAEQAGISASQFIREAALARAAAAASARGESAYQSLISSSLEIAEAPTTTPEDQGEVQRALSVLTRVLARSLRTDAQALRGENRQARRVTSREMGRASNRPKRPG